jgi:hypothetical protein
MDNKKHKNKQINGPINVIRLEGEINNVKKVLYIFMDMHIQVNNQTKCDDFLSEDVTRYIKKEMLKTKDKHIDFFMEHRMESANESISKYSKYKDRYIEEMQKFFWENFRKNNKELNNVRFHYADIRNSDIIFGYKYINNIISNYSCDTYRKDDVSQILKIYGENIQYLKLVNNILSGIDINSNDVNPNNKKKSDDSINKIKDIHMKYKNKDVKQKLKFLIDLFLESSNKLINLITENYDILIKHEKTCGSYFDDKGFRKKTKDIITGYSDYFYDDDDTIDLFRKNHNKIYILNIETHAILMDVYFLRRFCDKDYITHGIFYGGSAHCYIYINFLIKLFDFKITHAAYSSEKINKINTILKENIYSVKEGMEYFNPPSLVQCSDISEFPDNFD